MAVSPTQRSLQYLREQGYLVATTEKWNPHARIRQYLFGFIDMLAIKEGQTLAVQTTTSSCFAERRKKIINHENLPAVLSAGWVVMVHGWRKSKDGRWVLKEEMVS